MRNRYPGTCYKCGKSVEPGKGFFERYKGIWVVQCAIHSRANQMKEEMDNAIRSR